MIHPGRSTLDFLVRRIAGFLLDFPDSPLAPILARIADYLLDTIQPSQPGPPLFRIKESMNMISVFITPSTPIKTGQTRKITVDIDNGTPAQFDVDAMTGLYVADVPDGTLHVGAFYDVFSASGVSSLDGARGVFHLEDHQIPDTPGAPNFSLTAPVFPS